MVQLGLVEDGGGLGNTCKVKSLYKLVEGEYLLLGQVALGAPAQQRHVVEDGVGEVALGLQVLVAGVAVALGHLVLCVPHDGGAMDVSGDLPAEGVVQQVVLGRGGEVLAAAHHMGDAHEMVVDDVGEVVGGQAVALQQYLVVQGAVLHGDVAEHGVVEGGGALLGDALADDVGLAGLHPLQGLIQRQVAAGIVSAVEIAGVLLGSALLAEAVVGAALFRQKSGVLAVGIAALGLDVGGHGAANIGALVVGQVALGHGAVDDVGGALHQAALVGVLDAQDERTAVGAGDEPGV